MPNPDHRCFRRRARREPCRRELDGSLRSAQRRPASAFSTRTVVGWAKDTWHSLVAMTHATTGLPADKPVHRFASSVVGNGGKASIEAPHRVGAIDLAESLWAPGLRVSL